MSVFKPKTQGATAPKLAVPGSDEPAQLGEDAGAPIIKSVEHVVHPGGRETFTIRTKQGGFIEHIPMNESNRNYQSIMEWVKKGGEIIEADDVGGGDEPPPGGK